MGIAGSCYDCTSWNADPSCAVISLLVPCLSLPPNANIGAPGPLEIYSSCTNRPLVLQMNRDLVKQQEVKLCLTWLLSLCPQILGMAVEDMNIAEPTPPLFSGIIQDYFCKHQL